MVRHEFISVRADEVRDHEDVIIVSDSGRPMTLRRYVEDDAPDPLVPAWVHQPGQGPSFRHTEVALPVMTKLKADAVVYRIVTK